MSAFRYKAVSATGEVSEGTLEATSESDAVRQLQEMGLIPVRLRRGEGPFWARITGHSKERLSLQETVTFTQELATLLRAGLPLDQSLQMLTELGQSATVRLVAERALERVRGGSPLSDALDAERGSFSRFYLNMLRAGEAGGGLEQVLVRLADYMQSSKELRESVVSALIYPAVLVVVAVTSVLLLLILVVPHFTQLFSDAGKTLPLATQIVISSGDFLRAYWWALLLFVLLFVVGVQYRLKTDRGRRQWDHGVLRLPLFGDLIAKLEMARFSRTLGTLVGNGVPLLSALSIVKETLTNRVLSEGLNSAIDSLKQGRGMIEPLMEGSSFPRLGLQMIKVGEETGELEPMLLRVADTYDNEVRVTIHRMMALLEPVLIIGLGVIIAGIILSILVAIVSVNELAF